MIKFKHLVFICFFWILFFSCEDKKDNATTLNQETKIDSTEVELDVAQLRKDQDALSTLKFFAAVAKYGEPEEKEFIKIKEDSIPFNLDELIQKHYPNKAFNTSDIEIMEASWQLQNQSWIQVWYKLENSVWTPIDILVTA